MDTEAGIAEISISCHHETLLLQYNRYIKYSKTLRSVPDAHRLKWGESSEWTSTVNSVEENGANFSKDLDEKPLLSALYGMYKVKLNDTEVSAPSGQSDAVNKTSVE
jgi:hypothetical protein